MLKPSLPLTILAVLRTYIRKCAQGLSKARRDVNRRMTRSYNGACFGVCKVRQLELTRKLKPTD